MKIAKFTALTLAACSLCLSTQPLRAQIGWSQTASNIYVYTDPNNWYGGIVTNIFTNTVESGTTIVFTNDYTLTPGLILAFPGNSNVTFQSDSATPRTLHISLGHILRTNMNGGSVTLGTTNNPLVLDLNNSTRSIGGATPANSGSANIYTNFVYARIFDSNGTNSMVGVNLGGGNCLSYLLNNNNSFFGPVSYTLRGGAFSSIKNINGGPSAMGAPTDTTNGTVTVVDNTSFGYLSYLGTGDTTDRPFVWNLTGPLYQFMNQGSGKITFTGPWTLPFAANRTNFFTINAVSSDIELDGFLNGQAQAAGTAPTMTNLLLRAAFNTNRITLTGTTNNFMAFEFTNVILAFNNIADAGLPCALGTNGQIINRGNVGNTGNAGGGTGGANPSGSGASLQYFGPSATINRTIQLAGSGYSWGIDCAGTNSTLTIASDLKTDFFTGGGIAPRWLYLNADIAATNVMAGLIPDPPGISSGLTVVAANPPRYTVNNGVSCVRLLNPNNSFSGGVQLKYGRRLEVMSLADTGQPCSIGTGANAPLVNVQLSGINIGSTDSQRGGTLSYIGTTPASCNRQVSVFGLGSLSFANIFNDSPNNSSLHFSATTLAVASTATNCTFNWGGSAHATNVLDAAIPDTANNGPSPGANIVTNAVIGSIWQMTANHTYSGPTIVTNGTLLVEGSVGVTAGISGDVIVKKNGVLGGIGTINANVQVLASGTVSPGDFAIGTLLVNGNLTNNGTLSMEVNQNNHTHDLINLGANTIVYGGTLAVSNLAGSFQVGDNIQLFSAGSYQGSFASITPAVPANGLAWDQSGLGSGVLKVIAGAVAPPHIVSFKLAGANVIMTGTNGPLNGTNYVLTSTNVALAMSNWARLSTNRFDSQGNFDITNGIISGAKQQFFRLQLP